VRLSRLALRLTASIGPISSTASTGHNQEGRQVPAHAQKGKPQNVPIRGCAQKRLQDQTDGGRN
jgi:hypothetical protein